ncbi:MAG TPA: type II toxin-antitoxin system Phd/YefM family antitoxin [Thermotogae bacterium]|nr:type II toxin-antitoxin system Phd/YefM family antitoxin [Thermotogota bacterium]
MPRIEDLKFYSLAEAKAKFSQVVEEASDSDVVVTKNGILVVVIVDYSKYLEMSRFLEDVHDVFLLDMGDPSKREFLGSDGERKMIEEVDNDETEV